MKKILTTILSMMFFLSLYSCSPSPKINGYVKSAEKYGYYSLFNVSYGMPIEECKKALNINEKKIKIIDKAELGEEYEGLDIEAFSSDLMLFNKEVTALFLFYGDFTKTGYDVGLYQINIVFKKTISLNDAIKDIEKDLKRKKLSYNVSTSDEQIFTGYSNNYQISEIKNKVVKEKTKKLANTMYGKIYNNSSRIAESSLDGISLVSLDGKNLSNIKFIGQLAGVVGIATNQNIK